MDQEDVTTARARDPVTSDQVDVIASLYFKASSEHGAETAFLPETDPSPYPLPQGKGVKLGRDAGPTSVEASK